MYYYTYVMLQVWYIPNMFVCIHGQGRNTLFLFWRWYHHVLNINAWFLFVLLLLLLSYQRTYAYVYQYTGIKYDNIISRYKIITIYIQDILCILVAFEYALFIFLQLYHNIKCAGNRINVCQCQLYDMLAVISCPYESYIQYRKHNIPLQFDILCKYKVSHRYIIMLWPCNQSH